MIPTIDHFIIGAVGILLLCFYYFVVVIIIVSGLFGGGESEGENFDNNY